MFIPPAVYVAKEKTTKCYPRETHHERLLVFDEGLCPDLEDVRDALIPELCCEGFDLHAMGCRSCSTPGIKTVTILEN